MSRIYGAEYEDLEDESVETIEVVSVYCQERLAFRVTLHFLKLSNQSWSQASILIQAPSLSTIVKGLDWCDAKKMIADATSTFNALTGHRRERSAPEVNFLRSGWMVNDALSMIRIVNWWAARHQQASDDEFMSWHLSAFIFTQNCLLRPQTLPLVLARYSSLPEAPTLANILAAARQEGLSGASLLVKCWIEQRKATCQRRKRIAHLLSLGTGKKELEKLELQELESQEAEHKARIVRREKVANLETWQERSRILEAKVKAGTASLEEAVECEVLKKRKTRKIKKDSESRRKKDKRLLLLEEKASSDQKLSKAEIHELKMLRQRRAKRLAGKIKYAEKKSDDLDTLLAKLENGTAVQKDYPRLSQLLDEKARLRVWQRDVQRATAKKAKNKEKGKGKEKEVQTEVAELEDGTATGDTTEEEDWKDLQEPAKPPPHQWACRHCGDGFGLKHNAKKHSKRTHKSEVDHEPIEIVESETTVEEPEVAPVNMSVAKKLIKPVNRQECFINSIIASSSAVGKPFPLHFWENVQENRSKKLSKSPEIVD